MDGLENKKTFSIGFLILALAVMIGAFGAHGLEKVLEQKALNTFKTGNDYHFIHGFGWIFMAFIEHLTKKDLKVSKWLLSIGLILFSGFCYIYAISGVRIFALIVPIGGVSLIAFWLHLSFITLKK